MSILDHPVDCASCHRRVGRGVLRVDALGTISTRLPAEDAFYCSDKCLRLALLGLAPDEDPLAVLERKIAGMSRTIGEARRNEEYQAGRAQDYRVSLDEIGDLLATIQAEEMTRSIANDERGKNLRRILATIERHSRT